MKGDNINEGMIVTGGTVNANNIVVGHKAKIVGNVLQSASESLAGRGQDELAAKVEALRLALREHGPDLADSAAAAEHVDGVAAELVKEAPSLSVLRNLLAGLRTAVGPVTAVATAVTALTHAVTGSG
jgi:hypothetical protein